MESTTVRFPSAHETLVGTLHRADSPKGTLLFVHGLLSSRREFGEIPEHLSRRGWNTFSFDWGGHGESEGPRGRTGLEGWVREIRSALEWAHKERLPRPWGIVGHSAGSVAALRALSELRELERGAIVAPIWTLRHEMTTLEAIAIPLLRRIDRLGRWVGLRPLTFPYRFSRDPSLLYDDPEAARKAQKEKILQPYATLEFADDALRMNGVEEARRVRKPVLVVIALHDRAVLPWHSKRVFEALPGPKELREIASGHSMFQDVGRFELLEALDSWFSRPIEGLGDGNPPPHP